MSRARPEQAPREESRHELVSRLHAAGHRFVVVAAGGGSAAGADLLGQAGASRSMLEFIAPYSRSSLIAFLGAEPDSYCSDATARALAMAALMRALEYKGGSAQHSVASADSASDSRADRERHNDPPQGDAADRLVGVACTASLVSDRPKRGPHRVYVAAQSAWRTAVHHVELEKGARDRGGEERIASDLVLRTMADAAGVEHALPDLLRAGERVETRHTTAEPAWRALLLGGADRVPAGGLAIGKGVAETTNESASQPAVVFPGAFNPLHEGHREIADIAQEELGGRLAFELSLTNVDKPPLDYLEIRSRLATFDPADPIWLTRAPTFREKARLFPGATFVVGADTMARVADPRYYEGSADRDRAIQEIASVGCRFLVFGRTVGEQFRTLDDLELPTALARLCDAISESRFRRDVSSTELRERE